MCEEMRNINKKNKCESGGNLHTHLNSAKHNINEINQRPKG